MTINQVRGKIINKFGTISKFCRIANIDRYSVQMLFAAKKNKVLKAHQIEFLEDISKICSNTDAQGNTNKELTLEIRVRIKEEIDKLGGVISFCNENKEFSTNSIFQIIQGRRKLRSKKVNRLIDELRISL